MLTFALLVLGTSDSRLETLACCMSALRSGDSTNDYLTVRFLFEDFRNAGDRPSIAYSAASFASMTELLKRKDLDDSTRLEVCGGTRQIVTSASPLVPALGDYLADLKVRRVNRERGLRGGSGPSVEDFVRETITVIRVRATGGGQ